MILAVNLGVCPDYCYCNLRHLFAYNNILWEYHSPRETWHPQTQNVSNDILLDDFCSYLESFPCSELSSEPHGPIIMSGKLKSASGTQTRESGAGRGLNMSGGWRMATSANIAVINLTVQRFYEDLWSPSLPVPTLAGVAKLAIHLLRCLLQTEAGELAANIVEI